MTSDELILIWMAQGFIQSRGSKQMEDIGRECIADLVSRSLLNCVSTSYYTMHDLTHELARSVSGDDIVDVGVGKSHKNVEKVRHVLCLLSGFSMISFTFKDFYCFKSLRTLTCPLFAIYINNIPAELFIDSRHICILNLTCASITELPESIGNLLQLRCLVLSWTYIDRLPKSTTRLYNLQTLMLELCSQLVELPGDLSNLVNLRHLSLWRCSVSIPLRIGRLT